MQAPTNQKSPGPRFLGEEAAKKVAFTSDIAKVMSCHHHLKSYYYIVASHVMQEGVVEALG